MDLRPSRMGHVYGAFQSPAKASDYGFPSHLVVRSGDWPVRAFLPAPPSGVASLGKLKDQVQTGMCTGEGSSALGERLYRFVKGLIPDFAPEFTYYLERKAEGTLDQGDCGAQVATSLQVPDPRAVAQGGIGWCPTNVAGYTPLDITTPPSAAQLAAAALWPGGAYHTIGNVIANMKSAILSGYSFVKGINVYESFEDPDAATSGIIPFPNVNAEELLGGHELHSGIGYDDTIQCPNSPNPGAIMFQNSWGNGWGIKCPISDDPRGFAWISYDFLMNPNLATDVRLGHLGLPWAA